MQELSSLRHHFLIATPVLAGLFKRSIAYISEHDKHGAMGFVINKPLSMTLNELFNSLEIPLDPAFQSIPVYKGGPVSADNLFIMQRSDHKAKGQAMSVEGLLQMQNASDLKALLAKHDPKNFLFFFGYTSWSAGELEDEMGSKNYWVLAPADFDIMFQTPIKDRWKAVGGILGIDLNQLSHVSGHA